MKLLKSVCSLLTALMLLPSPVIASANDSGKTVVYANNKIASTKSVGLIGYGTVGCSVGTKKIHIKMDTVCNYYMDEIGFKNIYIQRSSDGVNWHTEKTIVSETTTNSPTYYFSDYIVTVNGNYYYRVNLDHYAKSGTLTEYCNNISNVIWIS